MARWARGQVVCLQLELSANIRLTARQLFVFHAEFVALTVALLVT